MKSAKQLLYMIILHFISSSSGAFLNDSKLRKMPELHYERAWKAQITENPFGPYDSASIQIDGDTVYVLNGGDSGNEIVMFDLQGIYKGTYPGWYNWPMDLVIGGEEGKKQPLLSAIGAMDDTGYLHFGMVLYNSSGSFFRGFMEEDTGFERPYGMAMLAGGSQVVVGDWQGKKVAIMEVRWTEGTVTTLSDPVVSIPYPYKIAVSSVPGSNTWDRLAVSSQVCCEEGYEELNVLTIFDEAGNLIKTIKDGTFGTIKTPNAVAIDPYGNILLVDSHQANLKTHLFGPDGEFLGTFGELGAPIKIVFHQGKVYTLIFDPFEEEHYVTVFSYSML